MEKGVCGGERGSRRTGTGLLQGHWEKKQQGKEEGGNRGGKKNCGSLCVFVRSCEIRACFCLLEVKGTVKLKEDRNGASSGQN